MGCQYSQSFDNKPSDSNIDNLNEIKTIPIVDERLALDARQVFKLKKSWKGIKRALGETGIEMFIR